jgi:outer membrane protein
MISRDRNVLAPSGAPRIATRARRATLALVLATSAFAGGATAAEPTIPSGADRPPAPAPGAAAPLTLAEALRIARARQPALLQAESARDAASAQADVSRSPLLPQVTGAATYSRATANFVAPAGSIPGNLGSQAVTSFDTFPFYRMGVSANQLIWDFGQTLNQWRAAKVGADAQSQSFRAAEVQVAFNVRTAFFTARAARDLVDVARDTLANLDKHLTQIEGFVQLGSRPEIDVSQARADRANGRVQLINAENGYDVARAQLNLAIGLERGVDYALSDESLPVIDGEDAGIEALVDEAARTRPELASLRLMVTGRELSLRSIREAHLPSLGFSTAFSDNGNALDRLIWNWSGALTLSVPIFLGGSIDAQSRQSAALLMGVRAQLDAERQQVRLEIEQARLGVRAAKGLVDATADALTNTRDRLRLAEGRYQTGVGNIIELGDAQVAATAAAAQHVQAEYQVSIARAQLMKALGRE